jgi:uncharacterized Zn-finger protein
MSDDHEIGKASEMDQSEFVPESLKEHSNSTGVETDGKEQIKKEGIVRAYNTFIGKSVVNPGNRTESIMVSCPMPSHPDTHPSAWLNSDKGVWTCGSCGSGGDIIDLGAIHFDLMEYKQDRKLFPRLIELMLEAYGLTANVINQEVEKKKPGEKEEVKDKEEDEEDDENDEDEDEEDEEDEDDILDICTKENKPLDWEEICQTYPDSFLDEWMKATSHSDIPNEYLFWLGLIQISLAIGKKTFYKQGTPVYPNLSVVLIGETGARKSRSMALAGEVLREALPLDLSDQDNLGVCLIPRPASGEALFEMFEWTPGIAAEPKGIRGYMEIDEFSEFTSLMARKGSTIREIFIGLSDTKPELSQKRKGNIAVRIVNPFLVTVTGAQPNAIDRILSNKDVSNGFANRFVYVTGTPKERTPTKEIQDIDLTGVSDHLRIVHNWSNRLALTLSNGEIEIEDSASERMDEIFNIFDKIKKQPNGEMFARLDLNFMKLITILAANAKTPEINMQIVNDVYSIMEPTLPITHQVSLTITETDKEYYRNRILAILARKTTKAEPSITQSTIIRWFPPTRRDRFKINTALHELEYVKLIHSERGKNNKGLRWFST